MTLPLKSNISRFSPIVFKIYKMEKKFLSHKFAPLTCYLVTDIRRNLPSLVFLTVINNYASEGTPHSLTTHRIHAVVTEGRYPTQSDYSPDPWCCHWRQVPHTVWLLTSSMVLSLKAGTPHSLMCVRDVKLHIASFNKSSSLNITPHSDSS